jgi:hypothetical protein
MILLELCGGSLMRSGWLRGGDLNPGPLGYEYNSGRNCEHLTSRRPNESAIFTMARLSRVVAF